MSLDQMRDPNVPVLDHQDFKGWKNKNILWNTEMIKIVLNIVRKSDS